MINTFNIFEFLDSVVPMVIEGLQTMYNAMFTTLYENMVEAGFIDWNISSMPSFYPQWLQDLLSLRMIEVVLLAALVFLIAHVLRLVWEALPIV